MARRAFRQSVCQLVPCNVIPAFQSAEWDFDAPAPAGRTR